MHSGSNLTLPASTGVTRALKASIVCAKDTMRTHSNIVKTNLHYMKIIKGTTNIRRNSTNNNVEKTLFNGKASTKTNLKLLEFDSLCKPQHMLQAQSLQEQTSKFSSTFFFFSLEYTAFI